MQAGAMCVAGGDLLWIEKELSTDPSSPKIEEAVTGESDFVSLEVHLFSIAVNPLRLLHI